MSYEGIEKDDPPLTPDQEELVSKLTDSDLEKIDNALLGYASKYWRKVASVVGATMNNLENRVSGIPDVFYAQRIILLKENGKLESQGNLKRMRFSEIKLT